MEKMVIMRKNFWSGRTVLITGHTGFKGSWLALWLNYLGANVIGISLKPISNPNLFNLLYIDDFAQSNYCDIRDSKLINELLRAAKPEIIFHLAAQPLVMLSYRNPIDTYSTNIMGTLNILDAIRETKFVKVVVAVTSDKVYKNIDSYYPYRESDILGGHDPYSASKAACEILISSYRDAFLQKQGIALASARAGNVIGGGDWSEDRLIPDAMRAWQVGRTLEIRRPKAIRPWQHVLEPLHGYLTLAEKLWHQPELAGAYNFGPNTHDTATVKDVIELARTAYGGGEVCYGDGSAGPHESSRLAMEVSRAKMLLNVQPRWSLAEALTRTIAWYQSQLVGEDARSLCLADITDYELAKE